MSVKTSVGGVVRKVIGWFLIVIASLGAASQVASLVTRMRPLMNGLGYLIFSAGILILGGYLVRKPENGKRHITVAVLLIIVGVIVVQVSF